MNDHALTEDDYWGHRHQFAEHGESAAADWLTARLWQRWETCNQSLQVGPLTATNDMVEVLKAWVGGSDAHLHGALDAVLCAAPWVDGAKRIAELEAEVKRQDELIVLSIETDPHLLALKQAVVDAMMHLWSSWKDVPRSEAHPEMVPLLDALDALASSPSNMDVLCERPTYEATLLKRIRELEADNQELLRRLGTAQPDMLKAVYDPHADLKQAVVDAVGVWVGSGLLAPYAYAVRDAYNALLAAQKPKTRVEWLWVYALSDEVRTSWGPADDRMGEYGWIMTNIKREVAENGGDNLRIVHTCSTCRWNEAITDEHSPCHACSVDRVDQWEPMP